MDEFGGLVVVLFLVLAAFMATAVRVMTYWARYCRVRLGRVLLSAAAPGLKSGDIILFIAHAHGFTNSLCTHDLYSHGGMVVELGGRLFLSETGTAGPQLGPGPGDLAPATGAASLSPLMARLKYYPGAVVLMSLRHPLTPDQEATLQGRAAEELPYPGLRSILKAALCFRTGQEARHCMQHVAWLVDELGLTPLARAARGITLLDSGFFGSSRAVTTLGGELLGGGNVYDEPVELLYDLGLRAARAA